MTADAKMETSKSGEKKYGGLLVDLEKLVQRSRGDRFNNIVALCVAIISIFLSFTSIKSGNVDQGQALAQRQAASYWNQYQAKRLRQSQLDLQIEALQALPPSDAAVMEKRTQLADKWQKDSTRYKSEMGELAVNARAAEATYATSKVLDTQLDVAQAFLTVALALLAVAVLSKIGWMLALGMIVGGIGVFFGLAAYSQWHWVHPLWLEKILGA